MDGQPIEFDGTVQEVADFLKTISQQGIELDTSDETKKHREEIAKEKVVVEEVKKNLPSVEDVVTYILSQKKYRHSTFNIMNHFFGRTFKARGITEGLYHDFLRLATNSREIILSEKGGNFRNHLEKGRHKRYEWTKEDE
jgi:hypothetical protein